MTRHRYAIARYPLNSFSDGNEDNTLLIFFYVFIIISCTLRAWLRFHLKFRSNLFWIIFSCLSVNFLKKKNKKLIKYACRVYYCTLNTTNHVPNYNCFTIIILKNVIHIHGTYYEHYNAHGI